MDPTQQCNLSVRWFFNYLKFKDLHIPGWASGRMFWCLGIFCFPFACSLTIVSGFRQKENSRQFMWVIHLSGLPTALIIFHSSLIMWMWLDVIPVWPRPWSLRSSHLSMSNHATDFHICLWCFMWLSFTRLTMPLTFRSSYLSVYE